MQVIIVESTSYVPAKSHLVGYQFKVGSVHLVCQKE